MTDAPRGSGASTPDAAREVSFAVLGWPPDGPALDLDHREFAYAGKFVMTTTGKAVARADTGDDLLAAAAFNADRTDAATLWIRYVTVRADRRGEGFGPRLCAFVASRARGRGYERVRIAVNNPFAYQALYRAGFSFTGEATGIAELVLECPPPDRTRERYQDGLDRFHDRDLSEAETAFLREKRDESPPATVEVPE